MYTECIQLLNNFRSLLPRNGDREIRLHRRGRIFPNREHRTLSADARTEVWRPHQPDLVVELVPWRMVVDRLADQPVNGKRQAVLQAMHDSVVIVRPVRVVTVAVDAEA